MNTFRRHGDSSKVLKMKIHSSDRFIPPRSLIDFDNAYLKLNPDETKLENQSHVIGLNKQQELHRQLDRIAKVHDRIFPISSAKQEESRLSPERVWPCHPRKRPFIRAEKVLDLPDFNCGFDLNPIDWGPNDCLVTSVGNIVLIGRELDREKVERETVLEYDGDRATAVQWSPDGRHLALGSESGLLLVWSVPKKVTIEERCCSRRGCKITVIQWHPESFVITWGCSRGKISICSLDKELKINVQKAHRGFICSLKFSPRGHFLCSSGQDAYLRIWKGEGYSPYMEIEMGNPSKAIAWHPWRSGLLAVGEGPPGSLILWNVNTAKLIFRGETPQSTAITALTFSPVTGELVFAQGSHELYGRSHSDVFVLGSPHSIIDSVTGVPGNVQALIWNADNTKLGAACSDETFRIWNYHQSMSCKRRRARQNEDLSFIALKKFKCLIR